MQGQQAPDFTGLDQDGQIVSLSQFNGKKVALYFYPKDNTPGCTKEACSFRDQYNEFKKRGIDVVGVSADSEKSHQTFAEKQHLPFILLSDPEKKTIADYGAYGEKKLYGKTYMGKSIVSVLSACVKCGTEIELVADGNDEAQALQDMVSAVNSGLGE